MPQFDSIKPGEVEQFSFDFTNRIGATGAIVSVVWACDNSSVTGITDPTPAARLIGTPSFDNHITTSLAGNMLNHVIYMLSATVTIDDGRVIILSGDVECTDAVDVPADPNLTIEKFREQYPAFANPNDYPDSQVGLYIDLANDTANSPIDPVRWGQFFNLGLRLWVAHNLAVQRQIGLRSTSGIAPGGGVLTSKSVGPVSLGYDLQFGMERDAGWYALSPYGNEFLRYLRLAGSAPIQL